MRKTDEDEDLISALSASDIDTDSKLEVIQDIIETQEKSGSESQEEYSSDEQLKDI